MNKDYIAYQYVKLNSGAFILTFDRPCIKIIIQGEPGSPFALNSTNEKDICYLGRTGYFELDLTKSSTAFLQCVTFFESSPADIIVDYFLRT